jgi:hypothetical protein
MELPLIFHISRQERISVIVCLSSDCTLLLQWQTFSEIEVNTIYIMTKMRLYIVRSFK